MSSASSRRREFAKTCLSAAALSVLPESVAHAQSVKQRLDWRPFVRASNDQSHIVGGSERLFYEPSLALVRQQAYNTAGMGYSYVDLALLEAGAVPAEGARITQIQMREETFVKPSVRSYPVSTPRMIGPKRRSLGGVRDIRLNEESITARLPVERQHRHTIQRMTEVLRGHPLGRAAGAPFKSAQIVFDDVRATSLGRAGGYFYKIFINLPQQGVLAAFEENHLIGSIGPFEIASAMRGGTGARLTYPVTRQLAATLGDPEAIDVSLVRVSGANAPQGDVISIGEVRIEISDDEVE